jgi:hypothetical protein
MKKILVILSAVMLVLAASTAWAVPTINIDDTLEAAPIVTTSGFTTPIPIFGTNPKVTTAFEFANVLGVLDANLIDVPTFGKAWGIKMLEPAFEGGGISDFAVLDVAPSTLGFQLTNLAFLSDGALNFDIPIIGHFDGFAAALAAFDLAVANGLITEFPSIVEDGTLQNLFDFSGLVVNAKSEVIPLPASVVLFGTGLLGLVPFWRLRRKA